jgi:hypothetical protein
LFRPGGKGGDVVTMAGAVAKDAIGTPERPGRLAGEVRMRRMWLMMTSW